jgi:hypothetical protein
MSSNLLCSSGESGTNSVIGPTRDPSRPAWRALGTLPRVRSSEAFGRRPDTRSIARTGPASETLHETGHSWASRPRLAKRWDHLRGEQLQMRLRPAWRPLGSVTRYRRFESGSLQRGVCKLSVPRALPRSNQWRSRKRGRRIPIGRGDWRGPTHFGDGLKDQAAA